MEMFRNVIQKLWSWLFHISSKRVYWDTTAFCGARIIKINENKGWQISLIYKDKHKPDRYSREELIEMLTLIRRCEIEAGWKVPEPVL